MADKSPKKDNAKKLTELQTLFLPLGLELVTQGSLSIAEAEEPYITFVENALTKARHAAQHAGTAAIADDSGLCVDALGGAPGVLSARYATLFGRPKGDDENNRVLLENMAQHVDRRARFVSVLVAVRSSDDPEPLIATGRVVGEVTRAPIGQNGFGFDPVMFLPEFGQTFAQLPTEVKNANSHRGKAARLMMALMQERWL